MSDESGELLTGDRVAHFEILEELGAGGMGRVYLARDLRLHRIVALKTLGAASAGSEEARRRLLSEARAASGIRHEGIVTIYEVGTEDGLDFISMERVEGSSLQELLDREGALEPARVLRFALALGEALAVAHAAGVIHRDLKPANIMVTPGDRVKILDFGLAKRIVAGAAEDSGDLPTVADPVVTVEGMLLGTPAYMAPEQALSRGVSARSDLFALGAVLYEMLTGLRAFAGSSPVEVLSAVLTEVPPPPSRRRGGIPPAWDSLVERLLAKDPAQRLSDAETLLGELRALGEETASTSADGPPTRNRRLRVVGAALGVLLLAGAGWWATRNPAADAGRAAAGPSSAAPDAADSFPSYRFRLLADLPGSQRSPSLSPDARMVAFVQEDEAGVDQVWVLDLAGGSPIQVTRGERPADKPRWDPKGGRIVFERAGEGIWEIPPLGGDPRRLVDEGWKPNLSPDGSAITFVSGRQPWIADADGTNPRPLPGFDATYFGDFAYPAFSPDGSRVVTFWPHSNRPMGDLWIVASQATEAESEPEQITDLGYLPWGSGPVWTADGKWIVFASDHGGAVNLWRVSPAGGEPFPVTRGAGSDYFPDLSDDLKHLVYTNGRSSGRIQVYSPETGEHRTVFERRDLLIGPEISPDGRRAVFFGRTPRSFHLFVVELESGVARQVTHGEGAIDNHPTWSSDGRWIYFYQQEPTISYRRVALEGGESELVVDDWRWSRQNHARPSPDGRRVAYTLREITDLLETRVRDLETGREISLPRALFTPQWSKDGSSVFGATWRPNEGIVECPVAGGPCETVSEEGWDVRLSADQQILYYLTSSPPLVWSKDLRTGEIRELHRVENYDGVDFGWGIGANGEIYHHAQHASELEIWYGEAQ